MCVCACVCVCVYERERERKKELIDAMEGRCKDLCFVSFCAPVDCFCLRLVMYCLCLPVSVFAPLYTAFVCRVALTRQLKTYSLGRHGRRSRLSVYIVVSSLKNTPYNVDRPSKSENANSSVFPVLVFSAGTASAVEYLSHFELCSDGRQVI